MTIWESTVFALKEKREDVNAWKIQVGIVTFDHHCNRGGRCGLLRV